MGSYHALEVFHVVIIMPVKKWSEVKYGSDYSNIAKKRSSKASSTLYMSFAQSKHFADGLTTK